MRLLRPERELRDLEWARSRDCGSAIGVENLTDEDPPIFPSFVQANTDPSQYDAFGRRYYASLRYSF